MTLIEDYLHIVGLLLPKTQRDDIVAELRDTVLTRVEARESELDRPLTEAETEALLREIGHPVVVAARYRGGVQHVVGPTLYPYWAFGVKIAIAIQVVLSAVVFLVHAFSGGDAVAAFGQAFYSVFDGVIAVVGFATLAVWVIERQSLRLDYLDRWRVRDLRLLEFAAWDWDGFGAWVSRWTRKAQRTSYGPTSYRRWNQGRAGQALGGLTGCCVMFLWWIGTLHFGLTGVETLHAMGINPGPLARVDWAHLKAVLFWPVLAWLTVQIGVYLLLLVGSLPMLALGLLDIFTAAGALALIAWIWQASPLGPFVRLDGLAQAVSLMETHPNSEVLLAPLITVALACTAFAALIGVARGLWRIIREPADA
jgi:hypothetical protein